MKTMRLTDAIPHADGWQFESDVTRVWNWEDSHHVFLVHRETFGTFADELTELLVQGTCIQQWAGLYDPEDIWEEISGILFIYHDVICEPLEQSPSLELPDLDPSI